MVASPVRVIPSSSLLPHGSRAALAADRNAGASAPNSSTNRGFGTARFSDNNIEAFNAELRTRVYTVNLFQTKADIELAPFFDLGKVSHEFTSNPVDNFHPAGGMGFRAIADPFVVGFVDVGYGDEGIAIFSGIDYPF